MTSVGQDQLAPEQSLQKVAAGKSEGTFQNADTSLTLLPEFALKINNGLSQF